MSDDGMSTDKELRESLEHWLDPMTDAQCDNLTVASYIEEILSLRKDSVQPVPSRAWKSIVINRFPHAKAKQGQWKIVASTPYPDAIGYGETEELAWQDAAYAVILEHRKERGGGSNE